jgi:DNA modification methylase
MQFIELRIGNVLDKLKEIPDSSIDCIVTSPPYYSLRKYKAPDVVWGGDPTCEHEWIERPVGLSAGNCSKCGAWRGQLGLEPDYHLYLDHLLMVTTELKRVLKPTGTLWWNMADSYAGSGNGFGGIGDPKLPEGRTGNIEPRKTDISTKSLMQLPTRFAIRMADEQGWILRNTFTIFISPFPRLCWVLL